MTEMSHGQRLRRMQVLTALTETVKHGPEDTLNLIKGSVTSTTPLTVDFYAGQGTASVGVSYLASYTPTVADNVWALKLGPIIIVLGKELP